MFLGKIFVEKTLFSRMSLAKTESTAAGRDNNTLPQIRELMQDI
jgi:hypothetical protein